jgi:hypothetical protein
MRLPAGTANWCLAVLLESAGFPSSERFAAAVNQHGSTSRGLDLKYDRVSVVRWLKGGACEHADVVAEVLSRAWGIPVPAAAIWPQAREGSGPVPAHLQPWAAPHTIDQLAQLVRTDLLTTHARLADAVPPAAASAVVRPIVRWLAVEPGRLPAARRDGERPVTGVMVEHIARMSADLATRAAAVGGGLCRDAAVGLLKYALDPLIGGHHDDEAGNALLAVVAELALVIADMSLDAGLDGPAQAYAIYALQAAYESTAPPSPLLSAAALAALAEQMAHAGHPDAGLRLVDAAAAMLSETYHDCHRVRAALAGRRAVLLAATGSCRASEAVSAIELAFDLHEQSRTEGEAARLPGPLMAGGEPALHRYAARTYLHLATGEPDQAAVWAARAEMASVAAVALWEPQHRRERAHSLIDLAHARLLLNQPDLASIAADEAADLAAIVAGSQHLQVRLADLLAVPARSCRR